MSNKQRMTRQQEEELDEYMREENEFFINNERNRQNEIIRQQDQQLDKLHENVKIVGQIGQQIGDEIEKQQIILDEMGEQVDNTDIRIQSSRRKIDEIIEKSSNWKIGTFICFLVIVLIIIIILIFVL